MFFDEATDVASDAPNASRRINLSPGLHVARLHSAFCRTDRSNDCWIVGSLRALMHRQLPNGSNFIMAKHIQAAIAPSYFEITIVAAMPLIDVLDDFDFPAVEANES